MDGKNITVKFIYNTDIIKVTDLSWKEVDLIRDLESVCINDVVYEMDEVEVHIDAQGSYLVFFLC